MTPPPHVDLTHEKLSGPRSAYYPGTGQYRLVPPPSEGATTQANIGIIVVSLIAVACLVAAGLLLFSAI